MPGSKHRDEIYDGNVLKLTFGRANRQRGGSGETYRFDFFEVGSTIKTSIGPDRKPIAGFDVPTNQVRQFAADLVDAAKALRRHIAKQP